MNVTPPIKVLGEHETQISQVEYARKSLRYTPPLLPPALSFIYIYFFKRPPLNFSGL